MSVKKVAFAMAAFVAVLGLAVVAGFTAGPARADTGNCTTDNNGTVTCVTQTLTQVGKAHDHESSSTRVVGHAQTGVTYLVAEHLVSKAQVRTAERNGACRWFAKIWNSGFKNGTGKMGWVLDHHVYACKINGRWYKEGGGITGTACENLLRLVKSPPPMPARVKGKFEFVDHMTWEATASVHSVSTAKVSVSIHVHNADNSCVASASSTASAKGIATATASATASSKASAKSQAHGKLVNQLGAVHQQASTTAVAMAKSTATANASAKASCSPSSPPPPPTYQCTGLSLNASGLTANAAISVATSGGASFKSATIDWGDKTTPSTDGLTQSHTYNSEGTYFVQATVTFNLPNSTTRTSSCSGSVTVSSSPPSHYTTLSCQAPEEITGGDSALVVCDVNNDNGAEIALNAQSQDSNSQVSGINCYSQGGAPSCQGKGTFQFRLKGVNDGSSPVTTTVKVVATSNGVKSDPVYFTINVDPSSTGF